MFVHLDLNITKRTDDIAAADMVIILLKSFAFQSLIYYAINPHFILRV